jgi:hypothetical protein
LTASPGGFGLTRSDLGLPPTVSPDSTGSGAGGGGDTGSGGGSGTPSPPKKKKPAGPNTAQQAAITVLEGLIGRYVFRNDLATAKQANAILDWLGVTRHDSPLGEITFLDTLLLKYRKAKNTKAETATKGLLERYGVHFWNPQFRVIGNAPQAAVIRKIEALMRGDIAANNLTAAHQANAILMHLGVGHYTPVLAQIANLDHLLASYKRKKDKGGIAATEELLRQLGVRHFAQGGTLWEPVVGFGMRSGGVYQFAEHGPEDVMPRRGGGGELGSKLDRLCALMERQNQITAAVPARTGEHVGSALGGAAQSASFRQRFPQGGW